MDDLEFQVLAYKSAIRSASLANPSKLTELACFFHETRSIPDAIRIELEARCLAFLDRKEEARNLLLASLSLAENRDLKALNDKLSFTRRILERSETTSEPTSCADIAFCRSLIARCHEIFADEETMPHVKIHRLRAHLKLLADLVDPTLARFEDPDELGQSVGALICQLPHTYCLGFRSSTAIALCAVTASEYRNAAISWRDKFHFSAADLTPLLRQ